MKRTAIFILIFAFYSVANAEFNGVTHHSRANCINNESISWDWTGNHVFSVYSSHYDAKTNTFLHEITIDDQYTRRAAAVHYGEGRGGWKVYGRHWMKDARGNDYLVASETVTDCSIYDGWWDRNK